MAQEVGATAREKVRESESEKVRVCERDIARVGVWVGSDRVYMCVCARVRACVRACLRASARVCVLEVLYLYAFVCPWVWRECARECQTRPNSRCACLFNTRAALDYTRQRRIQQRLRCTKDKGTQRTRRARPGSSRARSRGASPWSRAAGHPGKKNEGRQSDMHDNGLKPSANQHPTSTCTA